MRFFFLVKTPGASGRVRVAMAIFLLASFMVPGLPRAQEGKFADRILLGGDIITVNEKNPRVEAIAVLGERILALGTREQVLKRKGPDTEIIDLKGDTLLPGLVDAHTHPILTAMMSQTVDVSGFNHTNRREVMNSLKKAIAEKSKGDWIIAYGWDPALLPDLKPPTLKELDALAPENPVFIIAQTLHSGFVNSLAFRAAGITRDTPQPKAGRFEKDAQGNLTGTIIEVGAMAYFRKATPKYPTAAYVYLLTNQMEDYAKAGYTTITAPGIQPLIPFHLKSMREVAEHSNSPVRVFVYPLPKFLTDEYIKQNPAGPFFRVMGPKIWMDGSPYAGGMAMAEPYRASPLTRVALRIPAGSRGHLHYKKKEVFELVRRFHRKGLQISAHVQGERAADQFMDAVQAALKEFPRKDHRHRMEHNALVTAEQMRRAAGLGITFSFYMDHVHFYGDALHDSIVGPDRAKRFMAVNSAKKAGHRFSIHTDTPSSPMGPFRAIATAVTRKSRSGKYVLGASEGITPLDALKSITIHAAWQIFQEKDRGSLEVGKLADFTIVSLNPLKTAPDQWKKIEVRGTYLAGQPVVHSKWNWRKISLVIQVVWGKMIGFFS